MQITRFDIEGPGDAARALEELRAATVIPQEALDAAGAIIDDVRSRGDAALIELTRRFDGADLEASGLEVTPAERERALQSLDAATIEALELSASRIAAFARACLPGGFSLDIAPGVTVATVYRPLNPAGIYVPGGRFPYPSTVLMAGIPAREAGVTDICVCVPPSADGSVDNTTLGATVILGDCRVFRAGGAQAVAAMALGTETVPACRVISGPGNMYVTAAKRLLSHAVSMDLEAGPSEVAILIDGSAEPSYAAADALAQLEHDPASLAVVVSESAGLLEETAELASRMGSDRTTDGRLNLVRCGDRSLAVGFLNELAPEHLELMVEEADLLIPGITSAGCVFTGRYAAVALGDYVAGPSHVLPTGGTASRLSGLSVRTFLRAMNTVKYSREGFILDAEAAALLAGLEGLDMHARSIEVRRRSRG